MFLYNFFSKTFQKLKNKIFKTSEDPQAYFFALAAKMDTYTAIKRTRKKFFFTRDCFFISLYNLYECLDKKITLKRSMNKKLFIVHVPCWGEEYSSKCVQFLLPSLNTEKNLLYLTKNYSVCILMHCDKDTKQKVLKSSAYAALNKYVSFKFIVLNKKVTSCFSKKSQDASGFNVKYSMLGAIQNHAYNLSREQKGMVSFLLPDQFVSDRFYYELLLEMKTKSICLSTSFRTDLRTAGPKICSYYTDQNKSSLSISATDLVNIQTQHIHEISKEQFISHENQAFNLTPQMFFKLGSGVLVKTFHTQPYIIDNEKITKKKESPHPIDDTDLYLILDQSKSLESQVLVFTAMERATLCTLDHTNSTSTILHKVRSLKEVEVLYKELIENQPHIYKNKFQKHCFSHDFVYVPEEKLEILDKQSQQLIEKIEGFLNTPNMNVS